MPWNLMINFSIALFAILNPIGKVPVWTELTGDETEAVRRRIALLTIITTAGILLPFLLVGKQVLVLFNIHLAAFRIGGGILVLLTAISMVKGTIIQFDRSDDEGDSVKEIARTRFRRILVPLAIPMLAGPGTITTVMVYGVKATSIVEYAGLSIVLATALLLVFVVLLLAHWLEKRSDTLIFEVITRIFGLLLAGIAIQLILEGLGEAFPAWLQGASDLQNSLGSSP